MQQVTVLPKDYYLAYLLAPSIQGEIIYCDTVEDCLNAVLENKADVTYCDSYAASYYRQQNKYSKLQLQNQTDLDLSICIGISDTSDIRLISILNKALACIPREQLNKIISNNTVLDPDYTFTGYIYRNPIEFLLVVSLIAILIILLLVIILYTKAKYQSSMKKLLEIDGVTGYQSYLRFLTRANEILSDNKDSYALLYMDIKKFKYINDIYGYNEGNHVLCLVANLLHSFIQDKEVFTRMYADHFVILLRYENNDALIQRVESLKEQLITLSQDNNKYYSIIFSAGIFQIQNGKDSILHAIDRANYAKDSLEKSYQNAYAIYDEAMRTKVLKEKNLERNMELALQNKEFEAYYQPRYDITTGHVIGAEALVRWNHPKRGLLFPGEFISFFEQNGFITKLDFYIFEEACRFIREQMELGRKIVPISCNFSRIHVNADDFADILESITHKYNVPNQLLELEVTETAAIENFDSLMNVTTLLSEKGFLISIDDFGSGYSSIQLIQKLPIQVLKLDKSFIQNLEPRKIEQEIMQNIIQVSLKNGIAVICEGVETLEQEAYIKSYGCSYVQGFLYAKPMKREKLEQLLQNEPYIE